jgi:hypothetical protein
MTRLDLRVYIDPGEAQIFCNLLRKDGNHEKLFATVDTGAAVSLLPRELLNALDYQVEEQRVVEIEQAGIAQQAFQAVEASVTVSLEDAGGRLTPPFKILAWFAGGSQPIIGFKDVLDRSVLHIDMLQRFGWLEIDV